MSNKNKRNKTKNSSESAAMTSGGVWAKLESLERGVASLEKLLENGHRRLDVIEARIRADDAKSEVAKRLVELGLIDMFSMSEEGAGVMVSLMEQCEVVAGEYEVDVNAISGLLASCDVFTEEAARLARNEEALRLARNSADAVCHPDGDCIFVDGVHRVKVEGALGRLESDIVVDGEVYRDVQWVMGRDLSSTSECECGQLLFQGVMVCDSCSGVDLARKESTKRAQGTPRFVRPPRAAAPPRKSQKAPPGVRVRRPVKSD